MAKLGYYQGDPDKVLQAPADTVIGILNYESFEKTYEEKLYEKERENA